MLELIAQVPMLPCTRHDMELVAGRLAVKTSTFQIEALPFIHSLSTPGAMIAHSVMHRTYPDFSQPEWRAPGGCPLCARTR
jgi:hypothetical protein